MTIRDRHPFFVAAGHPAPDIVTESSHNLDAIGHVCLLHFFGVGVFLSCKV